MDFVLLLFIFVMLAIISLRTVTRPGLYGHGLPSNLASLEFLLFLLHQFLMSQEGIT